MCLIVLAWRAHPRIPLIVAANRDEFHARKAAPAAFWQDQPQILGGRDLQAMGTWMAVSRSGRFAAVTNYRGAREPTAAESRGALVTGFLTNTASPTAYMADVASRAAKYSGFNLLVSDRKELWWMSNRDGSPRRLEPGYYALGNLLLDSPEVQPFKGRIAETSPAVEPLFGILAPAKIINPEYGTRCSTVLLDDGSQVRYSERSFGPDGADGETKHYQFNVA
ncbi:MAG TPA: NRDE family protein [Burkholderiales bacterium]|nr:NRDE family protein [Burkholderiales bacterium]